MRKLSFEEMENVKGGNCFEAMGAYVFAAHEHATSPSDWTAWALIFAGNSMARACEGEL